jgi:hypothetical protein
MNKGRDFCLGGDGDVRYGQQDLTLQDDLQFIAGDSSCPQIIPFVRKN